MCLFCSGANLELFAIAGAWAEDGAPTKYALLIGINDYAPSKLESLDGAKNDIRLIKGVLLTRLGVYPENITELLDSQATHENVRNAILALTQKSRPGDMVYVHFSGHGSLTCSLAPTKESGMDSTWVTYGSRQGLKDELTKTECAKLVGKINRKKSASMPTDAALNQYDVLGKELNVLFDALHHKTGHVVVVSDSCHSGTITRGVTFKTRKARMDFRPHPLGMLAAGRSVKWLEISACQERETANEYTDAPNKEVYGLFTWFWAQALQNASHGDSWENIKKSAEALILLHGNNEQHPHSEGDKSLLVFGGRIENPPQTIVVKEIAGRRVTVSSGSLAGMTRGSVLRKYDPQQVNHASPTLKLAEVSPLQSTGEADGGFVVGDLLILDTFVYDKGAIRVFVRCDLAEDAALTEHVRDALTSLNAYQLAPSQLECDLVLQILRPKKDPDGKYVYADKNDRLPRSFPDAPAECWALTATEGDITFFEGQDNLKIGLNDAGLAALKENLVKLARVRNMATLPSVPGDRSPVQLLVDVYKLAPNPTAPCSTDSKHFLELQKNAPPRCWDFIHSLPPGKAEKEIQRFSTPTLLRFTLNNTGKQNYFTYLINITSKGEIKPFFPEDWQDKEEGLIHAGATRKVDVHLELVEPREFVRLIASRVPLDLTQLSQDAYAATREAGASPLEAFLNARVGRTRSPTDSEQLPPVEWSTSQFFFERSR